jgi:sulfate permease, SulP family
MRRVGGQGATGGWRGPVRGDVIAGVTVALVLVPQAIAYALLAGVPPVHGLYAAAVAPILAGLVGSSPYLQTGPVALTSLLTFGALAPTIPEGTESYAAHAALLAVIVGATRLLVGLARGGFVAYLMSQPVVAAFTLAAGVLIATSQVPALLGVSVSSDNPLAAAAEALTQPGDWVLAGLAVGLAVLAVTLLTKRVGPRLPGALLATLAALALAELTSLDLASVGDLPNGIPVLSLDLPWSQTPGLLLAGVVIALVGFAEPASIARRYASEERTHWDPDREFTGQGLANLGAGLFGGYPVGGSFSRSELNRLSGARTRWSGVVTGVAVLALLPAVSWLSALPKAALAGLIIASVLPLLNPDPVWRTRRWSRPQFAVGLVTFGVSVVAAPRVQWGVVAGVVFALAIHLWRELRLDIEVWTGDDELHVRPQGVLYFGSAPSLETRILSELADHPSLGRVRLHLQRLGRIDLTGALVLRAICRDLARADVPVEIQGVQPQCQRLVEAVFARDQVGYTRRPATDPRSRRGSATTDHHREVPDGPTPPRPPGA